MLAEFSADESTSADEPNPVTVVADLKALHLGSDVVVAGTPQGRLLAISTSHDALSPGPEHVHLSTERAELDVVLMTPCTIADPSSG